MFAQTPTPKPPVPADLKQDEMIFGGIRQETAGSFRYLRGASRIETTEYIIKADEIDYNVDTAWAIARGHVSFENYKSGEKMQAERGEYNIRTEEGKFWAVSGSSPAKVISRPGLLTTNTPFSFSGKWAEKLKDRYVLHHGFVTDCKMKNPWWRFQAPVFDIIPEERAYGRNAVFTLKKVPLFYFPVFYRPLGKNDRRSGFLTPNFGNSSRRGYMFGGGYYWAINRSYDATYRLQYFTQRGPAHTINFRGKPSQKSDFNMVFYGVQDKGIRISNGPLQRQGGAQLEVNAKAAELPGGFEGRLNYNYLSSFLFRQTFNDSFYSAIYSQVSTTGYIQKHWSDYTLRFSADRAQLFQSVTPNDEVVIDKLPTASFKAREREILHGHMPVWVSFDADAGLVSRSEPGFETGFGVDRENVAPRVMTALHFKGFTLTPSFTLQATHYGDSSSRIFRQTNQGLVRTSRDLSVDFTTPTIERFFTPPKWLHLGQKLKHVIEPRATFRYLTGVDNYNQIIRFDQNDIVANTNQLEISLTNRLYRKDKDGKVSEWLTWGIAQQRYFDQTFGGAVVPGQRNTFLSAQQFTPYSFITGLRNYSPVSSNLRIALTSVLNVDWRADYDPLRGVLIDSTASVGVRFSQFFTQIGQTRLDLSPFVGPDASGTFTQPSNQLTLSFGYGNQVRKGWNAASTLNYDYLRKFLIYQTTQLSYNTDCCGFSVQVRRYALGTRNENQFRVAFAIANIGSFGTLNRQDRIF